MHSADRDNRYRHSTLRDNVLGDLFQKHRKYRDRKREPEKMMNAPMNVSENNKDRVIHIFISRSNYIILYFSQ